MDFDKRLLPLVGIDASGDPLGENPFVPGSEYHRTWAEATATAEQQSLALKASWLAALPENDVLGAGQLLSADFDIWARRTLVVVRADEGVLWYDTFLRQYAEALLHAVVCLPYFEKRAPAEIDRFVLALRAVLGARVYHWRGEARRHLANVLAESKADGTVGESVEAKAARRNSFIAPLLKAKGLSRSGWAARAGVDASIVYDYLAGKSNPRAETRSALGPVLGLDDLPQ